MAIVLVEGGLPTLTNIELGLRERYSSFHFKGESKD